MTEREYARLKLLIEEKYRRDLESLERVWQLSQASGPRRVAEPPPVETDLVRSQGNGKHGPPLEGVTDRVRTLIPMLPKSRFTINDVIESLDLLEPEKWKTDSARVAISGVLSRFAAKGLIRQVHKGLGKRPSLYEQRRDGGEKEE